MPADSLPHFLAGSHILTQQLPGGLSGFGIFSLSFPDPIRVRRLQLEAKVNKGQTLPGTITKFTTPRL